MAEQDKFILIENTSENKEAFTGPQKCDKYDYLAAVGCGALGGIIDAFLVGAPGESILGDVSDEVTNKFVMFVAKRSGWSPKRGNEDNVKSAIGFLERKYRVNYDQRKPSDVDNKFNIAPNSHHMMSVGHATDIFGLFVSIYNQFTGTSTFIADGKLITINSDFELQGHNTITKIIAGCVNWFFHIMSDIAGSSGSHGRGTGLPAPFYEFFGFCEFGNFKVGEESETLAELAQSAFIEGYDFRFFTATMVPVILTRTLIRIIWAIRRHYQYKYSIKQCVPVISNKKNPDLRVMLLFGNGTLCVIDALDAGIKSGGNALTFFLRLNLFAWYKFIKMVIKEICIRLLDQAASYQDNLETYHIVDSACNECLEKLRKMDVQTYYNECSTYETFTKQLSRSNSEMELNSLLINMYQQMNIRLPWAGDFDTFMSNRNNRLDFGNI